MYLLYTNNEYILCTQYIYLCQGILLYMPPWLLFTIEGADYGLYDLYRFREDKINGQQWLIEEKCEYSAIRVRYFKTLHTMIREP